MQFFNSTYRKRPFFGFVLILFIVLSSSAYGQKTDSITPIKIDSILKKKKVLTKSNREKLIAYDGYDGPFVINDTLLYNVSLKNELNQITNFNRDSIPVFVDNKGKDSFTISIISEHDEPEYEYDLPKKMLIISDIEGNFNAFFSFLFSNNVIDKDFNWVYGKGHLVLNGDFVDRGKHVTQVLWLIYKLEQQAELQDGKVHFILGNHEILNFNGDHRYNRGKTIKAAKDISQLERKTEALRFLYSKNSEIGKWLSTKNVIEKIGDYIFTHAGLSPDILKYDLDLKNINKLVREKYYKIGEIKEKTQRFLYSSKGPFWYRGLAKEKLSQKELNAVLEHFESKKIIIGHTPVDSIVSKYNGKLIMTDIYHGYKKFSGKTFGLLVENGVEFIVDDTSVKIPLNN